MAESLKLSVAFVIHKYTRFPVRQLFDRMKFPLCNFPRKYVII